MDPDWDYDAHEAYEIQERKSKIIEEEKKEIQGARADKVSGVYTICQEYEKTREEQSRKKLKPVKQELLWKSYLKLKMIKEDNGELLKLLQVCQIMEKIKKM